MHVTSQVGNSNSSRIKAIISDDPIRRRVLEIVRSLNLPDCWIGAGFVRNAILDHLHGSSASRVSTDYEHCELS
ncbi:nucleotidyltransferase family protein [Pseudomonas parafulva]|uniref:nucleotidyltransferase family protein n=1 Tax=Pseudomonas parafulva TaxID=157782 RepID=UPI00200A9EC6|nr:nucleotidyltransferase family protein [Pseudomonas parafulva]